MKNIAIFSHKDTGAGQLLSMLPVREVKKVKFLISINKIKKKILNKNKKIEYVRNGKFQKLKVIETKNFESLLLKNKIKKVYIIEDDIKDRIFIFNKIKKKCKTIKIEKFIHKTSIISKKNKIGEGTIIFPGCYLGYKSSIGKMSIIQSNCNIEHHSSIGNFCNVCPNLKTGGLVKISDFCQIQMSVTIINKVSVAKNSSIGVGSLVLKNVPKNKLVYGRPTRVVRNIK